MFEHVQGLRFSGNPRLPVILQAEIAECGLACLAMVASYHGYETDLVALRQKFIISNQGIRLQQLINMAARLELASRPIKLDYGQLGQLQLPCILHWGMDHFVVLKKISGNKLIIHDPECGECSVNVDDVRAKFTGVALELWPTANFIPQKSKEKITLGHFWSKVTGLKRNLINISVLAILLQLFAVVSPFYVQTVVDDVVSHSDTNLLFTLALGFGLLLFIQLATSYLRENLILRLSNSLNVQMAANLFRHVIRLPMDYFLVRHLGDIVSRFGSLNQVRKVITSSILVAIIDGLLAVVVLVVMLIYSVKLTLIVLLAVILYVLLRYVLFRPLRVLTEEHVAALAKHDSHFMESVRAIQTIKIFQKENDRQSQWKNLLVNAINKSIRIETWNINYRIGNQLLFGLEGLIVVYFAALDVINTVMSLGMFYAFMSYKIRFTGAINSFIETIIEIKMLDVHLSRLADIVFTPQEPIDNPNYPLVIGGSPVKNDAISGKIEVRGISFRYAENEAPVFSSLSFVIEAGETVVFTGPSGCGKTTLLKCLMGLLTPFEGEILIDNRPLKKLPQFRQQIAAVMQDDQLLSGSIAENIACFESEINLDKVYSCAALACVHDEILALPLQYNTLVGDMGSSLSGGQRQRIILARALYREPRLLFLDEATSHLDQNNELLINDRVRSLSITRVMVAHRIETVNSADRAIELASL